MLNKIRSLFINATVLYALSVTPGGASARAAWSSGGGGEIIKDARKDRKSVV